MALRPRKVKELGAFSWMNEHHHRIHGEEPIEVRSDEDLLAFQTRFDVGSSELIGRGVRALYDGCAKDIEHRPCDLPVLDSTIQIPNPSQLRLLPPVSDDWGKRDGTVPHSEAAARANRLTMPTCPVICPSVDIMLVIALQLNLGRTYIDQCYPIECTHHSVTSSTLRGIMLSSHPSTPPKYWSRVSHVISRSLTQYGGENFEIMDRHVWFMPEVYEACVDGFPQVTWTTIPVYRCRGMITGFPDDAFVERKSHISIAKEDLSPDQTLQSFMLDVMRPRHLPRLKCDSAYEECDQGHFVPLFVLDRLPPVLTITFDPLYKIGMHECSRKELLAPFTIRYESSTGTRSSRYKPLGAVFERDDNSLVSRWTTHDDNHPKVLSIDTGRDESQYVDGWWDGLPEGGVRLEMLFYIYVEEVGTDSTTGSDDSFSAICELM